MLRYYYKEMNRTSSFYNIIYLKGGRKMAKDIQVKVNIPRGENMEESIAKVLGEIIMARIDDLPVEYKGYVLEKVLEEMKGR
jgi:hypothetical protein